MRRIIVYAAVLLVTSCQETIDPFEKKFSCLLTKSVTSDNQTMTYQYDASDRLTTNIYYDNTRSTYTYGTNGKLLISSHFNSSGTLQFSWEPTYSSDGKVSKVVYKNSSGIAYSEARFSYTPTVVKVDYFKNVANTASEEFTLKGANVTRYFLKVIDAAGKTKFTYEELYSDFQNGISPDYLWAYKIPGYPFLDSYKYNAYKTVKTTNTNFIDAPQVSTCTYTYTYNKSNATLTRASSCSTNGAASTSLQKSFTYAKCD